jgi:uncharacterized protein YdeI (YjbR/CyaY-like superfamily)
MPSTALPENAVEITTRAQWRRWLTRHHTRADGIWLVTWKKASGAKHVPYDIIVEEALCFGWIDSKPRLLDADRSMLWLAPRKARSGWSAANKVRIARAIKEGRMTPAGQAKIDVAKRDGSWTALDSASAIEIPPDLAAAFRNYKGSAANFAAFPPSTRRAILEWIGSAKRDETRAARVENTASLAARNERANQWKAK